LLRLQKFAITAAGWTWCDLCMLCVCVCVCLCVNVCVCCTFVYAASPNSCLFMAEKTVWSVGCVMNAKKQTVCVNRIMHRYQLYCCKGQLSTKINAQNSIYTNIYTYLCMQVCVCVCVCVC
jgi:hypothetical protein